MAGALTQYFFLVFCFFFCGLFGLWLLVQKRWRTALAYAAAEFGGLGAAYLAFPTMKDHIFGGARGQQALGSFFSLSALGDWAASVGRVLALLGRLEAKGCVSREKQGKGYLYAAALAREDYLPVESRSALERMFGGSARNLVAALHQCHALSKNEIRELSDYLDELSKEETEG